MKHEHIGLYFILFTLLTQMCVGLLLTFSVCDTALRLFMTVLAQRCLHKNKMLIFFFLA